MAKFNISPRYSYEPNNAPDVYSCIDDRTYDGADDAAERHMIGWGPSPEEALADLERIFEERADYQQAMHEAECERRGVCGFDDYAMNSYEIAKELGEK